MVTRTVVKKITAPGVFVNFFHIWAVPIGGSKRLPEQVEQPVCALWVIAEVRMESIEGGLEISKYGKGCGWPGVWTTNLVLVTPNAENQNRRGHQKTSQNEDDFSCFCHRAGPPNSEIATKIFAKDKEWKRVPIP